MRNHKKLIISVLILLVVAVGIFFLIKNSTSKPESKLSQSITKDVQLLDLHFAFPISWEVNRISNSEVKVFIPENKISVNISLASYENPNSVAHERHNPQKIKIGTMAEVTSNGKDLTYVIFTDKLSYEFYASFQDEKSENQELQNIEDVIKSVSLLDTKKVNEGCTIIPYKGNLGDVNTDLQTDIRGGATCHYFVNTNLPMYVFSLKGNPQENIIDQIEIIGAGGMTIQTLEVGADKMIEGPYANAPFFELEDINSDGYKDIKVLSWWGVTGNLGFVTWLFDPKTNLFDKDSHEY